MAKRNFAIITAIFIFFITTGVLKGQNGRILWEYYDNIPGSTISSLTSDNNFERKPSERLFLKSLEIPTNTGDNYGSLIRGYIHAPTSGDYQFYISGDDHAELWLSSDDKPQNKKKIAFIYGATQPREWDKSPSQISVKIKLKTKTKYYIEVLHKEDIKGDHLSVGWTLPNGSEEKPVPGKRLSPYETLNDISLVKTGMNFLARKHPRLQASPLEFSRLRNLVNNNSLINNYYSLIKKNTNYILSSSPAEYELPDGIRLLSVSRKILSRIENLAFMYCMELDSNPDLANQYADRAYKELEAAAKFPNWNPSHFLDVAEMSHAFALGYDRLFHYLSASQKKVIKDAIVKHSLKPYIECYKTNSWWINSKQNWNLVCNGGVLMAALAIGDEIGAQADTILELAINSLNKNAINSFGPDGSWEEGPMYWGYSVSYTGAFLSSLETALGGDFGLAQTPGLIESGSFPMYLTGPTREVYNYGDGSSSINSVRTQGMLYFALKYNKPEYHWFQNNFVQGTSIYNIMWYDGPADYKSNFSNSAPISLDPENLGMDKDIYYDKISLVTMRNKWNDTNAVYVGFKAGDNKASHSHADIGSFVFDALGYRWAEELGQDSYGLQGYFDTQRENYYRLRAEGQNTLVINPDKTAGQNLKGVGTIKSYSLNDENPYAIADITNAYPSVQKAERGIRLVGRKYLLIQDEILSDKPFNMWWFMHTKADIKISADGKSATLSRGDRKLVLKIISNSPSAKFTNKSATPLSSSPNPEGQSLNEGIRKVCVNMNGSYEANLSIIMYPLMEGEVTPDFIPVLLPLNEWSSILSTSVLNKSESSLLSPNPASDKINISLEKFSTSLFHTLKVNEISGKEILVKSIEPLNSTNFELDISSLSPGIYTLTFFGEMKILKEKFVVK